MEDAYLDLVFPLNGLDLLGEFGQQRSGTTRTGTNVRAFEPFTGRARGGQRSGITRYIDQQVSGTHLIQHLNYIVDPQAEALASDPGNDSAAGDDPTRNLRGGIPNPGGYQPVRHRHNPSDQKTTRTITLTASDNLLPADGSTTASLTALVKKSGLPLSGQAVTLRTSPSGRTGDGASGVTAANGQVVFSVSDTLEETVTYTALLGPSFPSNTVSVQYLLNGHIARFAITGTITSGSASLTLILNGDSFGPLTLASNGLMAQEVEFAAVATNTYTLAATGSGSYACDVTLAIDRVVDGVAVNYFSDGFFFIAATSKSGSFGP